MYSKTDMEIITNGYFRIVFLNQDECILKSKNTKHSWKINKRREAYLILRHKHHDDERFHFQGRYATMKDCILQIIGHDEYQLRGRKFTETKKRTYFDDIVDIYNNADECL